MSKSKWFYPSCTFVILYIWAKNIVSITIHTPLSPLCIWVHIIENENRSYRKRDYSRLLYMTSIPVMLRIKNTIISSYF